MEKVYLVEFMEYTNALKNTVSIKIDNTNIDSNNYLHVGSEPFLVRESELNKYRKYGNGFRRITFVGNISTTPLD